MPSDLSKILMPEFMKNPRFVGPNPRGTKTADLKIFQQVIRETLSDKVVLQNLVNAAMKQVEFKVR
jgi:hypothetical protein